MLRLNYQPLSLKPIALRAAVFGLLAAACSSPAASAPAPTAASPGAPTAPSAAPPTQAPPASSSTAAASTGPTGAASPAPGGLMRLVLAPDGNEARYLVTEQLANLSFPSDAIGSTSAITGALVITGAGAVVSEESRFVVDLTTLQSDSDLRDNYIQRSTLETRAFPTAEFVPTEAMGLPSPLPASGNVTFQLAGDLTVHGVTNRATWEVTAEVVDGRELVGSARTAFTFGDYGMTAPRVARVLSIEETIRLEFDFHLVRES